MAKLEVVGDYFYIDWNPEFDDEADGPAEAPSESEAASEEEEEDRPPRATRAVADVHAVFFGSQTLLSRCI